MAPTFMQLDIAGAFNVGMISVIFAFLFVDLFDTAGTLLSTADRAKLLDKNGQPCDVVNSNISIAQLASRVEEIAKSRYQCSGFS